MQFARASLRERAERARSHRLRAITRGSRLAPGLLTTATVGWVPIFAATTSRTIDLARWLEVRANNDTPHAESQPSRKNFSFSSRKWADVTWSVSENRDLYG